jgi:hypothetical protein
MKYSKENHLLLSINNGEDFLVKMRNGVKPQEFSTPVNQQIKEP